VPKFFGGPLDGLEFNCNYGKIWFKLSQLVVKSHYLWARYERRPDGDYGYCPPTLESTPADVVAKSRGLVVIDAAPEPGGRLAYPPPSGRKVTISTWTPLPD
jgi:hypothetical protein